MSLSIEDLGKQCHDAFGSAPGPAGVELVRQLIETALADDDFVATHLGPHTDAPRNVLYKDPDYGFCIIAHVYKGASRAPPHDHGPTWAIYGQVTGVTEMTEYRRLSPADGDTPGKVEATKSYDMEPGSAVAYQIGDLHAPRRESETRLIRVEGTDITRVHRDKYEMV